MSKTCTARGIVEVSSRETVIIVEQPNRIELSVVQIETHPDKEQVVEIIDQSLTIEKVGSDIISVEVIVPQFPLKTIGVVAIA